MEFDSPALLIYRKRWLSKDEGKSIMSKVFVPAGKLSGKKREFKSIVADIRHAVFSVVRLRSVGNGQFQTLPLGSGFFVSPSVFITCWHVIDDPRSAHRPDDKYMLVNNLDGKNGLQYEVVEGLGKDIHLFPDLDFAIIICRAKPDQAYLPIAYACPPVGAEIGVAGYPLPVIAVNPNGTADVGGLVYRVAKGTATAVYKTNWNAGDGHPLTNKQVVEVNFHFVPGNSGGPVFDAATGRAFGYVKGLTTPKINEFVDTAQITVPANMAKEYLASIRVVYSVALTLDDVRTQLEQFGVKL
jgi:V8-like Glu-specific endopeptidase